MRMAEDATFPEVPLHWDGKIPNITFIASCLDFVKVGQTADEFEKYPVSNRPGIKF